MIAANAIAGTAQIAQTAQSPPTTLAVRTMTASMIIPFFTFHRSSWTRRLERWSLHITNGATPIWNGTTELLVEMVGVEPTSSDVPRGAFVGVETVTSP